MSPVDETYGTNYLPLPNCAIAIITPFKFQLLHVVSQMVVIQTANALKISICYQ